MMGRSLDPALHGTSFGVDGMGPRENGPVGPSSTRGWLPGIRGAALLLYFGVGIGLSLIGYPLTVVGVGWVCGGLFAVGLMVGTQGLGGGCLPGGMWVFGTLPMAKLGVLHGVMFDCVGVGPLGFVLHSSRSMS